MGLKGSQPRKMRQTQADIDAQLADLKLRTSAVVPVDNEDGLRPEIEELRRMVADAGAAARRKPLPLYLRIRPQSANELGGTRSLQAPQLLSTKLSAPAYSFGGSAVKRLAVAPSASPGPVYDVRSSGLGNIAVSFGAPEHRPRKLRSAGDPGPASYSLPSSIGAHMFNGRMRSSRASSFGTAPARLDHFLGKERTPGAKYDLPRNMTREGLKTGRSCKWSGRAGGHDDPAGRHASTSPGPASYSQPATIGRGKIVVSTLRNEPAFGFGTASRDNSDFAAIALKHSRDSPGAGSYGLPSTLGPQLLSHRRSAKGRPFSKADRFQRLAVDAHFVEALGFGERWPCTPALRARLAARRVPCCCTARCAAMLQLSGIFRPVRSSDCVPVACPAPRVPAFRRAQPRLAPTRHRAQGSTSCNGSWILIFPP